MAEIKSDETPATSADAKTEAPTDGQTEKKGKKRSRILRILFMIGLVLALLYLVLDLLYQRALNDFMEKQREAVPIRINDSPREHKPPQIIDPTKLAPPVGNRFDVEWERRVEPPAQEFNLGSKEGILGPGDGDRGEIQLPPGPGRKIDKK